MPTGQLNRARALLYEMTRHSAALRKAATEHSSVRRSPRNTPPEIEVLGVAALAPATNLVDLASCAKDSAAGKVASSFIAGSWDDAFPELGLNKMITPGYSTAVQRIGCS